MRFSFAPGADEGMAGEGLGGGVVFAAGGEPLVAFGFERGATREARAAAGARSAGWPVLGLLGGAWPIDRGACLGLGPASGLGFVGDQPAALNTASPAAALERTWKMRMLARME